MEVLRSTNLNSIEFDLDTDIPSQEFLCDFYDNDAASAFMAIATSNTAGVVTLTLPSIYKKYDAEFDLTLSADGDELVSTNISLRRPYVEPSLAVQKLNITLEEATEYERVARMVIDSKTGGFRFFRTTNDYIGTGADYLTIPDRLHKLYAVYENGELIWDLESEWDFTLQIGAPQVEIGGLASSPILPTVGVPADTTRAADVTSVTGLTIGPLFFGQSFAEAAIGQLPFTAYHLLGNVAFGALLSPLILRWIVANPRLEASNLRQLFSRPSSSI